MSESEIDRMPDAEPGADAADDGDVPAEPLLGPPGSGDPGASDLAATSVFGDTGEGGTEAGLGGGEGDLGGGGDLGGDFGGLRDEGDEPTPV